MFTALIEAAQSKEVTVVVELMARFDEASNIRWARNLEDAGVQVFHGIVGLKTHCKLALHGAARRGRRDPALLPSGHRQLQPEHGALLHRYQPADLRSAITASMQAVFNYLTAHSESDDYSPAAGGAAHAGRAVHPADPARGRARAQGRPARIIAKMNSLLEKSIVEALYEASQAGVEIDLIVRGICSLRPGVKGLSERIRVRSIVGRFLEHSRIFYFANGGEESSIAAARTGCRATSSNAARFSSR